MRYSALLLLILISCGPADKNSPIEKTTLSIEDQITESYRQNHVFFNDGLQRNDTVYFHAGSIHETADFTGDEVPDFFVIEEYMGGPTSGHIHDGITGAEIGFEPDHVLILSRPGIDIQSKIVDVNNGDDRKELMVLCGGGGTIENRHYMEIYRYDRPKKKMKLIFTQNISLFEWDDNFDERLVEVNDISALTSPYPIDNVIVVSQGKFMDTIEPYNLNIVSPFFSSSKTYTFDLKQNEFVLTKTTIFD